MDAKNINQRLRDLRKSHSLNQTALAEQLGVTPSYVSAMELGKKDVTRKVILRLIELFKVSADWLISGKTTIEGVENDPLIEPKLTHQSKKGQKKSRSVAEIMAMTFTDEEIEADLEATRVRHERIASDNKQEAERDAHRSVAAARLYKRHPEAISEGLQECIALSSTGFDSDRIMGYLRSVTEGRIGEVLDRTHAGTISMAEAATEIKAITAPLDAIKAHLIRVETAVVDMAAAAVAHFPEARDIIGYHIHESLFERSGDGSRRKVDDKLRARAASNGEGAELPG